MSALTRARQVRAGPRLCFCGDVGQRVSPWMESSPHAWVKVEMAGFSWGRRRANIFNVPPDASRNRPAHTGPQGDGTGPCVRGCGVPRAQGAGGPPRAIRPARRRDPSVIRLVSGRETYTRSVHRHRSGCGGYWRRVNVGSIGPYMSGYDADVGRP